MRPGTDERPARVRGPLGGTQAPRLARLIENGRLALVEPVFDDEDLPATTMRSGRGAPPGRSRLRHAAGLVAIGVPRGEDPLKMARHLTRLQEEIAYAFVPTPRRPFRARARARRLATSRPDPLLSRQWGHHAVRISQARTAPGFDNAAAVVVAIADSGIDLAHPDLAGVVREYRNFVRSEASRDFAGHGTHVAGIVAARISNGIGIAGLCEAALLILKVLPSQGPWDPAGYYRGLAYCMGRARVLNLSLGSDVFDPAERDVIADVLASGTVVVAAMGNEHQRGNPTEYPAALPGVCAVGATDQADRRALFSNTGPHLSLCAPGVAIVSTTPTYRYAQGARMYDAFDGTSMAAPHVAAAAALLLAKRPALTPAQVLTRLTRQASRVAGMKGRPNRTYGWGRLDIGRVLASSSPRSGER
ncbi:MAG: S8 family serine peptidase [Acidobacteriota bacterium]